MSKTNCINCGAAKEEKDLQCPFCGTKYADLSMIELFSDGPLFIQLRNSNGKVITAKAYIKNTQLNYTPSVISCSRDVNGQLRRVKTGVNVDGKIEFALYESLGGN